MRVTVFLCALFLSMSFGEACVTDGDCAEGQQCYRPNTPFSTCISGLGASPSSGDDNLDFGTAQDLWDLLFDVHQNREDMTQECRNVQDGLGNLLTSDLQNQQCASMFSALNITQSNLDGEDEDADGSFDPALLDGFLIADIITNKQSLDTVCTSSCFPPLWATSIRAAEVCYDQSVPSQLNYICSKDSDSDYCVNYADDIAEIFQDLEADSANQLELLRVLRQKCDMIDEMGCCFDSYLELYSSLRQRLDDAVDSIRDTAFADTPQGQQIIALNSVMQAISPNLIKSVAHLACGASTGDPCPVAAAIQSAVDQAEATYPMSSHYNPEDPEGPEDTPSAGSSESSKTGGGAGIAVLVVLLVLGSVGGVGYWWVKRRTNRRFDGASISASNRTMVGEVVDFDDENDKGSYVPVVVDESFDGGADGGVML